MLLRTLSSIDRPQTVSVLKLIRIFNRLSIEMNQVGTRGSSEISIKWKFGVKQVNLKNWKTLNTKYILF